MVKPKDQPNNSCSSNLDTSDEETNSESDNMKRSEKKVNNDSDASMVLGMKEISVSSNKSKKNIKSKTSKKQSDTGSDTDSDSDISKVSEKRSDEVRKSKIQKKKTDTDEKSNKKKLKDDSDTSEKINKKKNIKVQDQESDTDSSEKSNKKKSDSEENDAKDKKKNTKVYNHIDTDLTIFENFTEDYITSKFASKFISFIEKDEYKENDLKKMYSQLWQHCLSTINSGFINDTKDLSQILDKIDNMVTLNKRLFNENTKLKTSDGIFGNTKAYIKDKNYDIYLLFTMKNETRVQFEIIQAWNLLFVALSILERVDETIYFSIIKNFRPSEIFTNTYNIYTEWFSETNGGSNFSSKLRILKKQRKQKKNESDKLVTKKKSKK